MLTRQKVREKEMGTTIEESKRNLNHAIKWKDRPTDESMALAIETMHKYQKIEQILHNGFGKGVYAVFDEIIEVVQDGIPTGSTAKIDVPDNKVGDIDCISRKVVLDAIDSKAWEFCDYLISKGRNDEQKPVSHFADNLRECICEELPSVTPQVPKCKDCKWWKDSDGEYRRGCRAESKCPINTHEVYCGKGYCYMFSPKTDMRGE